ncbi:protein of unknown function DUF330 [Paraglaciecola sp. T6c]|uniref:PqiC family protein n=1 Tax=Pseudoalteromonas atlantica (strain T6c / ATCC BAA-1087) TaxID=3042615 RepID=UPI00005C64D8|nr:ABC-type transport auxiliary lipoprotein family protein [Paraglaciecola sp. T6c]ABG40224.1 protein of unknown function DUF330 [Paraglaciecola sp. T6c]
MKMFSIFLMIGLISGCSSSSAPNRQIYLLNSDAPLITINNPEIEKVVILDKIQLADYLKRPNLVMQIQGNKLYYSDVDLWAESLQNGIHDTMLAWLNQHAEATRFVAYDSPEANLGQEHLILSVQYFMPTDQGTVISSGQFWRTGNGRTDAGKNGKSVSTNSFSFTSPLTQKGYSHSVALLAEQLSQLSSQIVSDFE